MAKDPDPSLMLAILQGDERTLDDWTTMFHLCLIFLPPDPDDAVLWIPVAQQIFHTFGDADCHTAFVIPGSPDVARQVLGDVAHEYMVYVDPQRALIKSLGLTRLPAFVHLRQNTTVACATEGWDPIEWQSVANEIGKVMAWTVPEVPVGPPPAAFAA